MQEINISCLIWGEYELCGRQMLEKDFSVYPFLCMCEPIVCIIWSENFK